MIKILKNIKKIQLCHKVQNDQRGIVLVIAITVMTLLLSVSFSMSNIVLRQIKITNINNASKPAFFVADSAAECAFYYDTAKILNSGGVEVNAEFATAIFGPNDKTLVETTVKCGNVPPINVIKIISNPNSTVTTFDVNYGDKMCAKVEVIKTDVDTKIVSRGYNTSVNAAGTMCDLSDLNKRRLVERGITLTY